MKNDLEALKKKYDGKSVQECVELAKQYNESMIEKGEKLFELLRYLRRTKRYREYKGYSKLEFKVFLYEVCHITYPRYLQLEWAYQWYPDECKKYQPHIITAIRQKVGTIKVPKVLKEIENTIAKIKKPEKRREAINDIIEKHSLPPKEKSFDTNTKSYWKQKYDDLWKEYQIILKERNELAEQLAKQKAPLETFIKMQDMIQQTKPGIIEIMP